MGALAGLLAGRVRALTIRWSGCAAPSRPCASGRAAGRSCIGVDDAQLLDPASAALVLHLVTSGTAFVVATVRTGERPPDAVVSLWKDTGAQRLELGELGEHGDARARRVGARRPGRAPDAAGGCTTAAAATCCTYASCCSARCARGARRARRVVDRARAAARSAARSPSWWRAGWRTWPPRSAARSSSSRSGSRCGSTRRRSSPASAPSRARRRAG